MINFIIFAVGGKLLIYVIQKFTPLEGIKNKYFHKLISCDFCLGCWINFFLALAYNVRIGGIPQVFLLSHFLIGIATSFLVHLISIGWREKFEVIVIE